MELFHMKRYYDEEESPANNENAVSEKVVKKRRKVATKVDQEPDTQAASVTETSIETKEDKKDDDNNAKEKATSQKETSSDFMVLGAESVLKQTKKKAKRILPRWLAEPNIISDDLKDEQMLVDDIPGIADSICSKLKRNGIRYLFPVQRQIVPHLLDSTLRQYYRPSDICVSAPTGSGKTLAFVLPIVQALRNRVVPRVRALVILPVQDLALQIYKVFKAYAHEEGLKVALLSSGQGKNVKTEQSELVCKGLCGENDYHSLVDIIVATPGRLVEHLHNTPGFTLQYLRYLIIDEADKVMDDISNDWLSQVETAVYSSEERKRPGPLTVRNSNMRLLPLQKLLFSATLSQNPEKLQELNLYEPKLFCSLVKPKDIVGHTGGSVLESYTTPIELTERFVPVINLMNKPLVLKQLLDSENIKNCLIFVRSVQNAHFLAVLLRQYGMVVGEMSSNVSKGRKLTLEKFKRKKLDYLVCTDALARGIDIGIIDHVISYDTPRFIKTYIHRVGRTARAGRPGTTYTLVHEESEMDSFATLLAEANKDFETVTRYDINEDDLDLESYEAMRGKASEYLQGENKKKRMKKLSKLTKKK